MPSPILNIEHKDAICHLTLNRPDKLNSLSKDMLQALSRAFDELPATARGVLLRGAGDRAFAAGADISAFPEMNTEEKGYAFARHGQRVFDKVEQCPVPVLALIQGYAFGGGSELAMAAHIRLAAPEAQFAQPEIDLGIIPGYGGTRRMQRLIGASKALEWMLSGERISAQQALQYGLIHAIAPKEKLLSKGLEYLNLYATKPKKAVAALLKCFYGAHDDEKEARLFGQCCQTSDFYEGVQAFLQKRPANFQGQ